MSQSPAPRPSAIHVVAAILRDDQHRILLTQRTAGRHLAGLWEFPGGKCEPGETPERALARELHEELGIDIEGVTPLIAVPFAYPERRILLDVFEVAGFRGKPHGREAQALAWVEPERLDEFPMPPADRPVLGALLQPDRYLVTPSPRAGEETTFLDRLQRALAAGLRRVQLRVAWSDPAAFAALAREVAGCCARYDAELLLNSRGPDASALAATLGVGLHLTTADLKARTARPSGPRPLAASCHDADELAQAQRLGCDFVVLGPVAATPSHPDARTLGWDGFAALRERSTLPIFALGGMAPGDFATARAHGAQGIAAIRGLWPDGI